MVQQKAAQDVIGRVTPESELLDLDASHSVPVIESLYRLG